MWDYPTFGWDNLVWSARDIAGGDTNWGLVLSCDYRGVREGVQRSLLGLQDKNMKMPQYTILLQLKNN